MHTRIARFAVALVACSLVVGTAVAGADSGSGVTGSSAWWSPGGGTEAVTPLGLLRTGDLFETLTGRLDLTPQQAAELKALWASELPELREQVTLWIDARRSLFDAIHANPPSEARLDAALQELARSERSLAIERVELIDASRSILTPEQQAELEQLVDDGRSTVERLIELVRGVVALRLGL